MALGIGTAVKELLGSTSFAKDAAMKSLDMLDRGIDSAKLTAQERIELSHKSIEVVSNYQEATKHQSQARRVLAFVVATPWGAVTVITAVFIFLAGIPLENLVLAAADPEATVSTELKKLDAGFFEVRALNGLYFLDRVLNEPLKLVLMFYFSIGVANSVVGAIRKR